MNLRGLSAQNNKKAEKWFDSRKDSLTPVPVHRTKVVKIAWIVHLLVQFYVERNFAKLFVAPKVLNYKVFLISLPKTSSSDAA